MNTSDKKIPRHKLERPAKTLGLRHAALFVADLKGCVDFYTRLLGMEIEWQPDPDNVYLTNGNDNLALHRWQGDTQPKAQTLDRIGFILADMDVVDDWHEFLQANGVVIKKAPKIHRDGAKSLYCLDPAGTLVQMIYHPPISQKL